MTMHETLNLTSEHPLMRDHVVLGRHVLSGLAYIDLFYQSLRRQGHDFRFLELRDLVIYRPLVTPDSGGVRIGIQTEPHTDGRWVIRALEEPERGGDAASAALASAEFHAVGPAAYQGEHLNLAVFKTPGVRAFEVEEIYASARANGLVHGEFMKIVGRTHLTDSAVFVDLDLTPEASATSATSMFHPALLDGAAVCGGDTLGSESAEGRSRPLVLPLYYKSFRAAALLNGPLLARIEKSSAQRRGELRSFSIDFFTPAGVKVARLSELTGKRVRDAVPFGGGGATVAGGAAGGRERGGEPLGLEAQLRLIVAQKLGLDEDAVRRDFSFYDLGLDSRGLLGLVQEIGASIGQTLQPTLLFEYVTIAELAAYLGDKRDGVDVPNGLSASGPRPMSPTSPATSQADALRATAEDPRRNSSGPGADGEWGDLRSKIRAIVAGSLGRAPQTLEDGFSFYDLGIDSKGLLRLVSQIGEIVGAKLHPTLLFEYTTIEELADHLAASFPQAGGPGPKPATGADDGETAPAQAAPDASIGPTVDEARQPRALDAVLRAIVAEHLGRRPEDLDGDFSFYDLGIDSRGLLRLVEEISAAVRVKLHPTLLFEHTTIAELSAYLTTTAAPAQVAEAHRRLEPAATWVATPQESAEAPSDRRPDDIAIIALEGRFPAAENLEELWALLARGEDAIVEIPPDRWDVSGFYDADRTRAVANGRSYSKWGGFFRHTGSTADVAEMIERRAGAELTGLVKALFKQAGYTRARVDSTLNSQVGVFLGAMADGLGEAKPSELVNGISAELGLRGPSLAIDTMSSSALSAIHMACESLRRGECRMAVAATLYLLQEANFIYLCRHGILGSREDSRSFNLGDGLLLSEAMGALILKPHADAMRDGDTVLAVIKGSGVNHAGAGAGGFAALQSLFAGVLDRADVAADSVGYVESSANGSSLGDAVEIGALARTFSDRGALSGSCVIGSVKGNIGHAAAASGFSQLAKVLLQLSRRKILASIRIDNVNPDLRLQDGPFRLAREMVDWPRVIRQEAGTLRTLPRRALVSSMGGGGAYACLLVEEDSSLG